MLPVIFIGNRPISTYWLMFLVGIGVMFALMLHRKQRFGIGTGKALAFTLGLSVCGLASVKLLFILENFQAVLENGLTLSGTSFFGAVFLVPLLMYPVGRLLSLKFGQTADASALCVLAMVGCMRVGCFLAGCCGGTEAQICGLTFHWPTQAVESIGDFAILAMLYAEEEQGKRVGRLYPMFMIGYSVLRFFVEFFRDTVKDWLGLGHGQWYAIAAIAVGLIWLRAADMKVRNDDNETTKIE